MINQKIDYFREGFGFEPANEDCFKECQNNSLLIPKLFRYKGMGLFEILAEMEGDSERFFLFNVGGASGNDADYYHSIFNGLTVKDSISFEELKERLSKGSYCKIVNVEEFEGGEQISVIQCSTNT